MTNIRLTGRNGQIWRDYCAGWTQERLAEEHGLSQARISNILAEVRASIPPEDLDEARRRTVDSLAELQSIAIEIARKPARQKYSAGRPMVDADGNPILDEADRLAAIKTATMVTERAAKLLGLDAAQKVEHGITDAAAEVAAQAAADAMSRLHGE